MEDILQFFREQFCNDIEFTAKGITVGMIKSLKSDIQLYNDSEILEYIKSKRNEIRYQLEGSEFKYLFTLFNIETKLKECLIDHFMNSPISYTKKIEFSNSIGIGNYKINHHDGILTVNTERWNYSANEYLFFSDLDEFMSLAQYIAWGNLFLELNKLDKVIREKIKEDEQKLKIAIISEKENEQNPEIYLNYSNNNSAEKIVFLYELGILDYLQDKMNKELHGYSTNKLAEIVSTFSGVAYGTAQSYLNPMFSKGVDQSNNPATPGNIEKVKNKLMKIGFNTTKSDNSIK